MYDIHIRKKKKYREIPYSVRLRENTDQKNSEYGYFSRSINYDIGDAIINLDFDGFLRSLGIQYILAKLYCLD